MPELFEDTKTEGDEPTEDIDGPGWGPPAGHSPVDETARVSAMDWLTFKWHATARGMKVALCVGAAFAVAAGVGWLSSRQDPELLAERAPVVIGAPTGSSAPPTMAPTTTAPPRVLEADATHRDPQDPLRALPDLHPMVVAFAGTDAYRVSNVISTLLAADPTATCSLFFGIDSKGWRIVPAQPGITYPNDHFPARVFQGYPCPEPSGVADPQFVPTTTTVKS